MVLLFRSHHPAVRIVAGADLSAVRPVCIRRVTAGGSRHLFFLLHGLVLFVDEALELALLQVADQNLPLLTVVHLRKLPQLVLLEYSEGPEV